MHLKRGNLILRVYPYQGYLKGFYLEGDIEIVHYWYPTGDSLTGDPEFKIMYEEIDND